LREIGNETNATGYTYIYAAFAESPTFQPLRWTSKRTIDTSKTVPHPSTRTHKASYNIKVTQET
jgi:hypothetical protein